MDVFILGLLLGFFIRFIQVEYSYYRVKKLTAPIFAHIENDELEMAEKKISAAEIKLGVGCPELTRARSLIRFLKD